MSAAPLWTSADAAAATGGRNTSDWSAGGLSIDSRTIGSGELFIALEGPKFDGHTFIANAFKQGAAAAVASHVPEGAPADAPLLLVENTLDALNALGVAARARSTARLAAVTGSVGKTGTKEALKQCLSAQAATAANVGSLNNHWGVPLSLARLPPEAVYGVFELGMNHPGEIGPLAKLVRPHVAVITNVEAVHLEFFNSLDAIADAKAEIFDGMDAEGTAVLNRDNPHFARLAANANRSGLSRVLSFGEHAQADIRLLRSSVEPTRSSATVDICGTVVDYSVGLPGVHWIKNSMAVLGAVYALGADVAAAAIHLDRLRPLKGRGERYIIRLPAGPMELIDDSYNANPTSVRAAIAVVGRATPSAGGRRIAVLGDMLELGEMAPALHAALAVDLELAQVDLVFTCGANMTFLHRGLPKQMRGAHAASAKALAPIVSEAVGAGDLVLVKGSAGSRTGLVVEALRALDQVPRRAANGE